LRVPAAKTERFQVKAESEHYGPIQGKSRFRAIPGDELLDRELIVSPRMRRAEAVEYRGFGVI
jgi:hypothetical protein